MLNHSRVNGFYGFLSSIIGSKYLSEVKTGYNQHKHLNLYRGVINKSFFSYYMIWRKGPFFFTRSCRKKVICFVVSVCGHTCMISYQPYTTCNPFSDKLHLQATNVDKNTCIQGVTQSFQANTKTSCFWKQHISEHGQSNFS